VRPISALTKILVGFCGLQMVKRSGATEALQHLNSKRARNPFLDFADNWLVGFIFCGLDRCEDHRHNDWLARYFSHSIWFFGDLDFASAIAALLSEQIRHQFC
jgi:hypothetical protein